MARVAAQYNERLSVRGQTHRNRRLRNLQLSREHQRLGRNLVNGAGFRSQGVHAARGWTRHNLRWVVVEMDVSRNREAFQVDSRDRLSSVVCDERKSRVA